MPQTILLDGVTLPAVSTFSEDQVYPDIWVRSKGDATRRSYNTRSARRFHLTWEALTATELNVIKPLAHKATTTIIILRHPSETYLGNPAEFPVVINPQSPGLQIDLVQGWVGGVGPLTYEVTMELITQRLELDASLASVNYPPY